MTTQLKALNKIEQMYISKKITLQVFRTSIMRCKIMVDDNLDNIQKGVIEKLNQLSILAKNL